MKSRPLRPSSGRTAPSSPKLGATFLFVTLFGAGLANAEPTAPPAPAPSSTTSGSAARPAADLAAPEAPAIPEPADPGATGGATALTDSPVDEAPAPLVPRAPDPKVEEPTPIAPVLPPVVEPPREPERLPLLLLEKPAKIEFGRKTIYEIRTGSKEHPAEARAKAAVKALTAAIEEESPESIQAFHEGDVSVVYAGTMPVLQLFAEDARAHGDSSLVVHADATAVRFRHLVEAEQRRKTIATRVFSVSLVVLLTLVALYLLGRTSDLTDRARGWLESHRDKIPAIRVQSMELVGPGAVRSGTILGVEVAKWLLRFAIVYLWLLVSLSQFEATSGYVQEITSTFLRPLTDVVRRLATSLPLVGVLAIAVGSVVVLVRFVELFFAGVARRETELPWVKAETALSTSVLLRLGIVLAALLFGAPLVTGNVDGVLSRSGFVVLAAIGLGATPLLACLLAGITNVFGEKLRAGELVVFGGRRGRIAEVGLLFVVLETSTGSRLRVPQLLGLFQPVEFLGARGRTRIEVPVQSLQGDVLGVLRRAALSVGTQAEIEIARLDAQGALCRISVLTDRGDARSALYLAVARELEEAGLGLGRAPREGAPS